MCASALIVEKRISVFPYRQWSSRLRSLSRQYRENAPVPHLLLKDFLNRETARLGASDLPRNSEEALTHYQNQDDNRLGIAQRALLLTPLGQLTDELSSPEFTAWLSELTGITGLLPGPALEGAGLHQSGRGGVLNVHTDFSHHHYIEDWRRRINLILYLNEGWQEAWGGAIELWDQQMRAWVAKYAPLFNQALIFNTDERSFHGFPEPLSCPAGSSRRSLALYYYTLEQNARGAVRSTDYRSRPGDGIGKSALIRLDKQAVNLYCKAKTHLGFSDHLASRILAFLSKRK